MTGKNPPSLSEYEHACWLSSLFFTDAFWDQSRLVSYCFVADKSDLDEDDLEKRLQFLLSDKPTSPIYKTYDDLYADIEAYLKAEPEQADFYQKVVDAILAGHIEKRPAEINEWGENTYTPNQFEISSYSFFLWVEKNICPIPEKIMPAIKTHAGYISYKKHLQNERINQFHAISPDQFSNLCKEPLWNVADGIVYLFGYRGISRPAKIDDFIYIDRTKPVERFIKYIADAHKAKNLDLIDYQDDTQKPDSIYTSKVSPQSFIAWAKTLPIELPMLLAKTPQRHPVLPAYITSDMELMFDAIEKFWAGYDLSKPDPSKAPMKKDVVGWLLKEAKNRSLDDFSKTRADAMDTIIRCRKSRVGGSST